MQATMISFQDEGVEITYFEDYEVGTNAVLLHNILIKEVLAKEDIEEVQLLIQDIIQKGKDDIRNPVQSFTRPRLVED